MNKRNELPLHQKLILLCARTEANDELKQRILGMVKLPINWTRLVNEAILLETAPLLWLNLKELDLPEESSESMDMLRSFYYQNLVRNLYLSHQLLVMIRLLKEQSIRVAPIKGILLAETVFGNPGLRQMFDLDILIPRESVVDAIKILTRNGFSMDPDLASTPDTLENRRDVAMKQTSSIINCTVEVHWRFKDTFFRLPERDLWENMVQYKWQDEIIPVLSPELTVIHLIHHLHYHGYPLKILVDIAEALRAYRQQLDWDKLLGFITAWQMRRTFLISMKCVEKILDHPFPKEVERFDHGFRNRVWLVSIVSNEHWYFGRKGFAIREDDYLSVLFSFLFLDGSIPEIVAILFRRTFFRSKVASSKTASRSSFSFPLRRWLSSLVGLMRGILKLLIHPG